MFFSDRTAVISKAEPNQIKTKDHLQKLQVIFKKNFHLSVGGMNFQGYSKHNKTQEIPVNPNLKTFNQKCSGL